ncbi:hypothetical protein [Brevundimonas sp.]|uniref:hypothetical protein n=1 Tax=Brevundimonas sp. TaxID=1871086 RepID=UPI00273115A8|nr:hypothetical protein [Brevundimonas sp.]MDP1913223.1 hypothetical protein [Brevundimonas sp.]
MTQDIYGNEAYDYEMEAEDSSDEAADDVDDMLDALIEADDEDLSERKRRGRRGRSGGARPPVRTASGTPAYRAPMSAGPVTQAQLKDALGRVGTDVRRNAEGIKAVNSQLGRLTGQVKDIASVNGAQSGRIGRLDRLMKLDGAIDFATSFSIDNTSGTTLLVPNLSQLLRGALKSGMVGSGDAKSALSNPLLIGGLGFLLNNPQVFTGLLGGRTT